MAGSFYADDRHRLRRDIGHYLSLPATVPVTGPAPKAVVVPHAGYVYSGAVAAQAYRLLQPLADKVYRVVLLGPAHRVPVSGIAVPAARALATPLGDIPVDHTAIRGLAGRTRVVVADQPHQQEHSLEVQLPFLQVCLGDFRVVPLLVGDAAEYEVQQALDLLWGDEETLVVVSSDLSHYLDHAGAAALDRRTAAAVESMRPEAIGFDQACGRLPLGGLLRHARQRGMRITRLDLRNSGDTAGPRDRVVGYGAWALYEAPDALSKEDAGRLRRIAWASIRHGLETGSPETVDLDRCSAGLRRSAATFVTLESGGALRGCIGSLQATRPLAADVSDNAWAAACRDPRFAPVAPHEIDALELHISVLSPPEALRFTDEVDLVAQLRPGLDGLVIRDGSRQATFLPQVWQSLPEAGQFLRGLKEKAGMPGSYWSATFEAQRYRVQEL